MPQGAQIPLSNIVINEEMRRPDTTSMKVCTTQVHPNIHMCRSTGDVHTYVITGPLCLVVFLKFLPIVSPGMEDKIRPVVR